MNTGSTHALLDLIPCSSDSEIIQFITDSFCNWSNWLVQKINASVVWWFLFSPILNNEMVELVFHLSGLVHCVRILRFINGFINFTPPCFNNPFYNPFCIGGSLFFNDFFLHGYFHLFSYVWYVVCSYIILLRSCQLFSFFLCFVVQFFVIPNFVCYSNLLTSCLDVFF